MDACKAGSGPYGTCQRCGFTRRLNALRKEWTGLRVCPECFDPRPADQRPPKVKPEGIVLPSASPEPAEVDRSEYGFEPGEDL